MASLSLTVNLTSTGIDGTERPLYFANKQITSLATTANVMNFTFAGNDTVTVWNPTVDSLNPITDFDFIFIVARTGSVQLECTCNEGDANEALDVKTLVAGVPFILAADDSVYGAAASQGIGGSADVIDKLRIKDISGAANEVTVIIAT